MYKIESLIPFYILSLFWSYIIALFTSFFKVESTVFYCHHFALSSTNSLPIKLNKGSQLIVGLGVLLPVDVFAHFYILFTSVHTEVNLSIYRIM